MCRGTGKNIPPWGLLSFLHLDVHHFVWLPKHHHVVWSYISSKRKLRQKASRIMKWLVLYGTETSSKAKAPLHITRLLAAKHWLAMSSQKQNAEAQIPNVVGLRPLGDHEVRVVGPHRGISALWVRSNLPLLSWEDNCLKARSGLQSRGPWLWTSQALKLWKKSVFEAAQSIAFC